VSLERLFGSGGAVVGSVEEQAAVLALTRATTAEWYRTATVVYENRSALTLLHGQIGFMAEEHRQYAEDLISRVDLTQLDKDIDLIDRMASEGIRLLTVLDEEYPENLQLIYNLPPFIWVRGTLCTEDFRAIAVVGSRTASDEGKKRARRLASDLAKVGVTVLSGLARGIDAAVHTGALSAGGRTVAVIGQGLRTPLYPKENQGLAEQILDAGALVSQFWPDAPPCSVNFPMRNVVMSGMGMGTVVVEASSTSGAKMQARLALEHGKRLFLLDPLVKSQEWARRYAERPGVTIVRSLDDVLDVVMKLADVPEQLVFQL
jgi:DNA processing protein